MMKLNRIPKTSEDVPNMRETIAIHQLQSQETVTPALTCKINFPGKNERKKNKNGSSIA